MKTLLIVLFGIILFTSCNMRLFVNGDKVIRTEKGFILFSNEGDYFLPSEIDTTVEMKADFLSKNIYEKGFKISINTYDRAFLLKYYADTLTDKKYFLSVEMDYLRQKIMPKKLSKQEKKYYSQYSLSNGKVVVTFRVNNMGNKVVSVFPYLSESKKRELENRYEK